MPLVLLKGHARFWYCFEKKSGLVNMSLRRNIGSLCTARDKREAGGAVSTKNAVNFIIT